jgi:hypothetical protein
MAIRYRRFVLRVASPCSDAAAIVAIGGGCYSR